MNKTTALLTLILFSICLGSLSAAGLVLPTSGTATSTSTLLSITNNGTGRGIYALTVAGDRTIFAENRKANGFAIYGLSDSGTNAAGVYGISAAGRGVVGVSTTGRGVHGVTTSGDCGVCGQCKGTAGAGVLGISATGTTSKGVLGQNQAGFGVYGVSVSGIGVYGTSSTGAAGEFVIKNSASGGNALYAETDGTGMGIYSCNEGKNGGAGYFANCDATNPDTVLSANACGAGSAFLGYGTGSGISIYGMNTGTGCAGAFQITNASSTANALSSVTNGSGCSFAAISAGTGPAGIFQINSSSNTQKAIQAQTMGTGSAGYFWIRNAASGAPAVDGYTEGSGPGVLGRTAGNGDAISGLTSGTGVAICGSTNGTGKAASFTLNNSGSSSDAVYIFNNSSGSGLQLINWGTSWGGYFRNLSDANTFPALQAETNGTGPAGTFWVHNTACSEPAVHAITDGTGSAIEAETSTGNAAIVGTNTGTGWAGYFIGKTKVSGNLDVTGTLTKASGSFKIDHPLDPENKYLYHSFVESPDMMNIYNGNVTLDENGEAWVQLPDYFEALNKDFRYQLTCIGGFAPVYVAEEISNNMFKIGGGTEGLKVSWQVTGVRQDPYAKAHPIVVEQDKPADEKGTYMHPELYGQNSSQSVDEPMEKSVSAAKR